MKRQFILLFVFLGLSFYMQAQYNIIVDKNGSGHFRTVQQAIDSVRAFNPAGKMTIFVKKGVYREKLLLQTHTCNVHIIGEDRDSTILTFDDGAKTDNMGTFRSYSFKITGNDITLENLTVENAAGTKKGQAVALHIEGDRAVFINCRFLGNQDTIYTGKQNARHLFYNCYIEGTTDFIFGPSTAWFEGCTIFCKSDSYITAASTPAEIEFGYIFNKCKIVLADNVKAEYLGRPWRAYAMTLFMNCEMPAGIRPAGWFNWSNPENEKTARYMEFNNMGEGAQTSERVKWAKILTKKEAKKYTLKNVMKGYDNWMPLVAVKQK